MNTFWYNEFFWIGDRPHANDQDREAGLPSKKTAGTERSAERLMEAIQTYKEYQNELDEAKMNNQEAPSLPLIMSMYPDIGEKHTLKKYDQSWL